MPRSILYIAVDDLFASIEQRDRPQLRGRPVAVRRGPSRRVVSDTLEFEDGDGFVGAVSAEARRKGVRAGLTTKAALERCPDLVLLAPDPPRYRAVGQQVHAILGDFTRRIESPTVDGCWLDVTDGANVPGLGSATAVARRIRERVRGEVGLSCSIGVASLKFVARLASDHRKPDGLTVVPLDQLQSFVHPLPVERLEGMARTVARRLEARGIRTIGDLAKLGEPAAVALLGRGAPALVPWRFARGLDPRRVSPDRSHRARAAERTFPVDVYEAAVLEREIERQLEPIASELSVEDERARLLTLKLRYSSFEVTTRSRTLEPPTRETARLVGVAKALLHDHTDVGQRGVRLVGVSLSPDQRTSAYRRS